MLLLIVFIHCIKDTLRIFQFEWKIYNSLVTGFVFCVLWIVCIRGLITWWMWSVQVWRWSYSWSSVVSGDKESWGEKSEGKGFPGSSYCIIPVGNCGNQFWWISRCFCKFQYDLSMCMHSEILKYEMDQISFSTHFYPTSCYWYFFKMEFCFGRGRAPVVILSTLI